MEDTFEKLLSALEENSIDNCATISNVRLFVDSWRAERKLDEENTQHKGQIIIGHIDHGRTTIAQQFAQREIVIVQNDSQLRAKELISKINENGLGKLILSKVPISKVPKKKYNKKLKRYRK